MSDGLWEAIRQKDWARLKTLVSQGVKEHFDDFDYKDYGLIFEVIWSKDPQAEDIAIWWLDHGYPPAIRGGRQHIGILHAAAAHGMARLIEKVLELAHGWLAVDAYDYDHNSPLWYASKFGQVECVKKLLELGANPDGFDLEEKDDERDISERRKETPLHVADNAEIAHLLLDAGASLEIKCYSDEYLPYSFSRNFGLDDEYLSLVTTAIIRGKMDVAKVLMNRGAKLEDQALRLLALKNDGSKPEDVIELVKMGLNPDGEPGKEPLRIGARSGNAEICKILLKMGAKPLPEALYDAVRSGDLDTVKVFLKKRIGDEAEALRLAAKRGDTKIVDFMLYTYPDLVDAAFLGAIEGCDFRLAHEFIDNGANVNFTDKTGRTPLITLYAIDRRMDLYRFMRNDRKRYEGKWNSTRHSWFPQIDDFEEKTQWEFNLNRPDNWNDLLKLSDDDALALAIVLIEKGADIHAKDNMGRTALWHACSMCWAKSIPFLVKLGLNINERDKEENSAFDAGCLSGESLTIRPMVEAGAIVDAQDENGDTALIKCAKACLTEKRGWHSSTIMTLLVDFNADPDLKNHAGFSMRSLIGNDKKLKWVLEYADRRK